MAALRQHDELERQRRERQRASRTPTDQEIDAANASMHEVMEQQLASFGGGRSHIEVPQSAAGLIENMRFSRSLRRAHAEHAGDAHPALSEQQQMVDALASCIREDGEVEEVRYAVELLRGFRGEVESIVSQVMAQLRCFSRP